MFHVKHRAVRRPILLAVEVDLILDDQGGLDQTRTSGDYSGGPSVFDRQPAPSKSVAWAEHLGCESNFRAGQLSVD